MKRFVIVGNGPAGMKAAETIRQIDQESPITVISNEEHTFYYRRYLPRFISGKLAEKDLAVKPLDFYEKNRITQKLGKAVTQVRPAENSLVLEDGEELSFSALLIATGGHPIVQSWPGKELAGVFTLRTLRDAKDLMAIASPQKRVVIVGGGLLGLNLAQSLQERGLTVTLLGRENKVCSNLLDKTASDMIIKKLTEKGIALVLEDEAKAFVGVENQVKAVLTAKGKELPCDMVGIAIGTRPNIDFLKDSGIIVNKGVIVDQYMRTNFPNIYAAGDVAQAFDITCGEQRVNTSWGIAEDQGAVAAKNMAGIETRYQGCLPASTESAYDIIMSSIGIVNPTTPDYEIVSGMLKGGKVYKRFVIKDSRLHGSIVINDVRDNAAIERVIREGIDLSTIKNKLLDENFSLKQYLSEMKR